MKRLLLGIFALLVVSFSFGQRLWVQDSYIRVYDPVSKADMYFQMNAILKVYVKGTNISLSTYVPSQDFVIKYGDLTQYNGGTVPAQADIVTDIKEAMESNGFTKYFTWATDTVFGVSKYYYFPTSKNSTWNFAVNLTCNTDSTSFIPYSILGGIRTVYPGLDTIVSTSTGPFSWDDVVATGDSVAVRVISTDTTVFDKIFVKVQR